MKKKITLIEFVSYSPRHGFVWHRRNGTDKPIHATNPKQLEDMIREELKKEATIYDKLKLNWRQ